MTADDFQQMIDDMTTCFMTGDADGYVAMFSWPLSLVSPSGPRDIKTESDVRDMFDLYIEGLARTGADELIRVVKTFDDCHDGTYLSNVETHFFSRGNRLAAPHTTAFLLRNYPDGPKIISLMGTRNPQEATTIAPFGRAPNKGDQK